MDGSPLSQLGADRCSFLLVLHLHCVITCMIQRGGGGKEIDKFRGVSIPHLTYYTLEARKGAGRSFSGLFLGTTVQSFQ